MNLCIRIVIRVSITTLGEFILKPIMCTEHYNLLPKILIMSYSVYPCQMSEMIAHSRCTVYLAVGHILSRV